MTRRAARMLAALEAGCETRDEIFDHQGGFSLLNNAASELRRVGIEVVWDHESESYRLLDDGRRDDGAATSPAAATIIEHDSGQFALDLVAA